MHDKEVPVLQGDNVFESKEASGEVGSFGRIYSVKIKQTALDKCAIEAHTLSGEKVYVLKECRAMNVVMSGVLEMALSPDV